MTSSPYSIVVLVSGNGSNLQAIIDQIDTKEIKAEISAVISNRPDAFALERAEKAGIPNIVLEHSQFIDRESFDESLAQIIDSFSPDLVILAGFMRILSDGFVEKFQGKLINIHPSLLPKYKGLHTHKKALENNDNEHGASVHFVIPELDAGAVLIQGIVPVESNDTEESLAERVHQMEHVIYPNAVEWLVNGDVQIKDNKVFLNDKLLLEPVKINSSTL